MAKRKYYDVVILGAGPAGLECARVLQGSSKSVLLIEKNKEAGLKACAGGITLAEKIVDPPQRITRVFRKQLVFLKQKKYMFDIKNTRFTFDRPDFGKYQLSKLKPGSNVEVMLDTMATDIQKDRITTSKGVFRFGKLVGADGSNSIVRKFLKLKTRTSMGLYYEFPGKFNEFVGYFDPTKIGHSYIWEFPHKTHNNIGIYFDPVYLPAPKAKDELHKYMKRRGYAYEKLALKGAVINYYYQGYHFGNMFLIGDAGGFTSELHGGGINNAMESGRDVANIILDPSHKPESINRVLRRNRFENRVLRVYRKIGFLKYPVVKLVIHLVRLGMLPY